MPGGWVGSIVPQPMLLLRRQYDGENSQVKMGLRGVVELHFCRVFIDSGSPNNHLAYQT